MTQRPPLPDDPDLHASMAPLGLKGDDLIAIGGESCVFDRGDGTVVRVNHSWATMADVDARTALLKEIGEKSELPFAIPQVSETIGNLPRIATIEPKLAGVTLQEALKSATPDARERLIISALDSGQALGRVPFTRPWVGDLFRQPTIRTSTWKEYLIERARDSLRAAGKDFAHIDPAELAAPFTEPQRMGFVHFDLYAGNFLVTDDRISAVLDFGGVAVHGDPQFDLLALAVYLRGDMTDAQSMADESTCRTWLGERGIEDWFNPAERWLAAMWSFATDDTKLHKWCRRVLLARD